MLGTGAGAGAGAGADAGAGCEGAEVMPLLEMRLHTVLVASPGCWGYIDLLKIGTIFALFIMRLWKDNRTQRGEATGIVRLLVLWSTIGA